MLNIKTRIKIKEILRSIIIFALIVMGLYAPEPESPFSQPDPFQTDRERLGATFLAQTIPSTAPGDDLGQSPPQSPPIIVIEHTQDLPQQGGSHGQAQEKETEEASRSGRSGVVLPRPGHLSPTRNPRYFYSAARGRTSEETSGHHPTALLVH